jgi:hypothetical protein
MTFTLSIITVLSIATTGALLLYVARLLVLERERSEARVAALAVSIRADGRRGPASVEVLPAPAAAAAAEPGLSFGPRPLFSQEADAERPGTRRWTFAFVAAAVLAGSVALALLTASRENSSATASPSHASATEPAQSSDATALELLSLRHARDNHALTISGLVRNPHGAAPRAHTDVVVLTFDHAGTFITTVRASLTDADLRGGAESPFSVTIPDGERINRYRISFRAGNQVLPHVDRRR